LDIYNHRLSGQHIRVFGHDPGVCAYANGAIGLWLLGYPDQAHQNTLKGLALAEKLGHPFSIAIGQWGTTMIAIFRGEDQLALARANQLDAFSKDHGFSRMTRIATMMQGISIAHTLGGSERMVHMREVYNLALSDRRFALEPWVISEYVSACISLNALNEGFQAVERELADSPLTGQRLFESEIRRGYGELILAKDENQVVEAEDQFLFALDIARRQSARSLELRAVMSLARLWQKQGKREEAHQLLAASYEWFSEGFDTADLIAAKKLLDELQ
jgi:hypothetical protein